MSQGRSWPEAPSPADTCSQPQIHILSIRVAGDSTIPPSRFLVTRFVPHYATFGGVKETVLRTQAQRYCVVWGVVFPTAWFSAWPSLLLPFRGCRVLPSSSPAAVCSCLLRPHTCLLGSVLQPSTPGYSPLESHKLLWRLRFTFPELLTPPCTQGPGVGREDTCCGSY